MRLPKYVPSWTGYELFWPQPMPGAAESIEIGTCMPALFMRANMHAETLISSCALGGPLSQPGASPIDPEKL